MTTNEPIHPTGCFLDYTYCANVNCKNECGRKMSDEIKKEIEKIPHARVSLSYFCGEEEC